MSTYKLKRKLEDGTLEDVILQCAGGGPRKISATGSSINIQSDTVGAYLNLFGVTYEASELCIGDNTITLDSGYIYFYTIQGMLYQKLAGTSTPTYYWHLMVTLKQEGGSTVYSDYTIITTSGFNISDNGQVIGGASHYSGILSE